MPDVVGIRFKQCGKAYDFEIGDIEVKEGDQVIVESDFGLSLGRVIRARRTVEQGEREFKRVLRVATEEDFRQKEENKKLEQEARAYCLERIMARGLQMKLVTTEATLDRKRIVFYFTADGRIDFRELVKDLAAKFKTRIEMRQIGVRDEAKLVGGFGVCGLTLCCNTFLSGFEPISIKMAKKQEMVLNVGKLSGLCSRLMCCLRYEYDGDLGTIRGDEDIAITDEDKPVASLAETAHRRPHHERRERPERTERPERHDRGEQRQERPSRPQQQPRERNHHTRPRDQQQAPGQQPPQPQAAQQAQPEAEKTPQAEQAPRRPETQQQGQQPAQQPVQPNDQRNNRRKRFRRRRPAQ